MGRGETSLIAPLPLSQLSIVEKLSAIVDCMPLLFKLPIQNAMTALFSVAAVTFFTGTLCKNRYSETNIASRAVHEAQALFRFGP
jgi:hypothetical protein